MSVNDVPRIVASEPLRDVPLKDLLAGLAGSVKSLVDKEVELARAEVRADVNSSLATAKAFGAAAVCGLVGTTLVLVAVVFALAAVLPGWAAALVVAAPFVLAAAALGGLAWSRRVRHPLGMTRNTLKETLEWARERLS